MRKTVIYNTGETIRFRCWNRKGYAIFRSLPRYDWACMQKHCRFRIEKGQKHAEP